MSQHIFSKSQHGKEKKKKKKRRSSMAKINTRIFWNIFSNLLKQNQNFPVLRKHNFPTPVLNFRHSVLWVIELQFGRGSWADKQSQTTAKHLNNICHKSYHYHFRYLLNASQNICVYLIYWEYSNSDQEDTTQIAYPCYPC